MSRRLRYAQGGKSCEPKPPSVGRRWKPRRRPRKQPSSQLESWREKSMRVSGMPIPVFLLEGHQRISGRGLVNATLPRALPLPKGKWDESSPKMLFPTRTTPFSFQIPEKPHLILTSSHSEGVSHGLRGRVGSEFIIGTYNPFPGYPETQEADVRSIPRWKR